MSNTQQPEQVRTYFGWQNERVNFLFGLTARRASMIGGAAVLTAWPLAVTDFATAVVCWPVALFMVAAALIRVHGRTSDEWLAAAVSYQLGRLRNWHKFAAGPFTPAHDNPQGGSAEADLPGILAPLEILEAPYSGSAAGIAMAYHRIDRTYTAVARVTAPGIGLADTARSQQRVDGWGSLLAGLCVEGSPITRMQVLQRIVPESGAAMRAWHADHLARDAPQAAVEATSTLLATSTLTTSSRETFLGFTLDARKAAGIIKAAGGGSAGAGVVLTRQLRALVPQIASADIHVRDWLTPRDLAEVVRTAFEPHAAAHLADRREAARHDEYDGLDAGVPTGAAGPAAAVAEPGSYIHDGAVSVTYWIHEWPRSRIHATLLGPILGEGRHRRALSLHYQPLPPRTAEREVMKERTSRQVAVRMRQRTGQIIPEHERAALERAEAQDAERAAGHGLTRVTGYVTVTVTDADELDDACAALEADAATARIEIRRMWMAQDLGFACSALPLGFGIPNKRW